MKIDRMLEIIMILLNHESTSAKTLAEHFQVSVRTIQRDMISISLAGIPIYATEGKKGGYSILPEYKVSSELLEPKEQELISKALKSLATSYSNESLESLIQKYNAKAGKEKGKVFWDFSVTKENAMVQDSNQLLEQAIADKLIVTFHYRNASGVESEQEAEPLAIHYKWYAWYLFAWSVPQKSYRTYKVARISELVCTHLHTEIDHGDVEQLMKDSEQQYYQTCLKIELQFRKETIGLMKEYFPDCPVESIGENKYRLYLEVPQKERLWKALILSFGNQVEVIGPPEYKKELIETAQLFLENYDLKN